MEEETNFGFEQGTVERTPDPKRGLEYQKIPETGDLRVVSLPEEIIDAEVA